jgi:predicted phosphoribosyltransferase
MIFQNRRDAGRALARAIAELHDLGDAVVLGLPRGGVPVAYEVARSLNLPLDIFIVRKLGVPGQEELAMGAIASGGTVVTNQSIIRDLKISPETIEAIAQRERLEIERREKAYRDGRPPIPLEGRTAVVVDDGLATGASMLAAARALRPRARRVIAAVPVASEITCNELSGEVDQIICAATPQPFFAVGMFYRDFAQTTDEEVRTLLSQSRNPQGSQVA